MLYINIINEHDSVEFIPNNSACLPASFMIPGKPVDSPNPFMDHIKQITDDQLLIRALDRQIKYAKDIKTKSGIVKIPKCLCYHPENYPLDNFEFNLKEAINQSTDGFWEIVLFRQVFTSTDPNYFYVTLLKYKNGYIPIRFYDEGGVDIDPDYQVEFLRNFNSKERHFILGFLLRNQKEIRIYSSEGDSRILERLQSWAYQYNASKVAKRLRLGNNYYYDKKTRRKIKNENVVQTVQFESGLIINII